MRAVTLEDAEGGPQPLFVDFVNSLHWYEGVPVELIGTPTDLAAWLVERGLPALQTETVPPELHVLREQLRRAAEALARRRRPAARDLDAMLRNLAGPAGHLVLVDSQASSPRLAFQTDAPDGAYVAFRMALSFATFLRSDNRQRLKLCANPGCGFLFVDTSTNRTRRWCFMRYCGNRLKVRAFRRRQRDTTE